jgi:hypothetical protein
MKEAKSWTARLAGVCSCFSEPDEEGHIKISETCPMMERCSRYALWTLLKRTDVPPLQIPFTIAIMRTGLYSRAEIVSALCEVFQVSISRANVIWSNSLIKLKSSGLDCYKTKEGKRYIAEKKNF